MHTFPGGAAREGFQTVGSCRTRRLCSRAMSKTSARSRAQTSQQSFTHACSYKNFRITNTWAYSMWLYNPQILQHSCTNTSIEKISQVDVASEHVLPHHILNSTIMFSILSYTRSIQLHSTVYILQYMCYINTHLIYVSPICTLYIAIILWECSSGNAESHMISVGVYGKSLRIHYCKYSHMTNGIVQSELEHITLLHQTESTCTALSSTIVVLHLSTAWGYLALSDVKYLLLLYGDVVLLRRYVFQWVGAKRVPTQATNGPLLDDIRIVIRGQPAGLQVGTDPDCYVQWLLTSIHTWATSFLNVHGSPYTSMLFLQLHDGKCT